MGLDEFCGDGVYEGAAEGGEVEAVWGDGEEVLGGEGVGFF